MFLKRHVKQGMRVTERKGELDMMKELIKSEGQKECEAMKGNVGKRKEESVGRFRSKTYV